MAVLGFGLGWFRGVASGGHVHRLEPSFLARGLRLGPILVEAQFGFLGHALTLVDHILAT